MFEHHYKSSLGYKALVIACATVCLTMTVMIIIQASSTEGLFGLLLFFLVLDLLIIPPIYTYIFRPIVVFNDQGLFIRSWFGKVKRIDPSSPMVISTIGAGYVIEQNTVLVTLIPNSIGRKGFNDLIKMVHDKANDQNKPNYFNLKWRV